MRKIIEIIELILIMIVYIGMYCSFVNHHYVIGIACCFVLVWWDMPDLLDLHKDEES
jgi:hypothetical protein